MSFFVVETQLSDLGLRVLQVAAALGLQPTFVTDRLERYAGLRAFDALIGNAAVPVLSADTGDADSVTAALRAAHAKATGVFTMCDYNLPVVSEVAAQLGLAGLAPAAAKTCRNKLLTRHALAAAGLPTPKFAHPATLGELADAVRAVGLPCVVKPMTESASVDVRLCYTLEEAARHYEHIAGRPLDARGQPRPAGALVEEYLVGVEVSVETITVDGATTVLGVTDKQLGSAPVFAEVGDVFPSLLPQLLVDRCAGAALAGLAAVGHDFGAAHTEMRIVSGQPVIVEINGRLGGDDIPDLIRLSTGIDILAETIRQHAGLRPSLTRATRRGAAWRAFSPPSDGVVTSIRGLDVAASLPGVVSACLTIEPGAQLTAATSNHATYGYVLAEGETAAVAMRLADFAASQISIEMAAVGSPDGGHAQPADGMDPV